MGKRTNTIQIRSKLYDYSVEFVENFVSELNEIQESSVTYVIDKNVYELYKDKFKQIEYKKIFFVDPVENKKNMDTVMELMLFWKHLGVRKNWKVICVGGGISQDITTIACNLFLRNIEWYFFPTTLLAMCDSCIGGKCGINLGEYKNQIGVFYPPKRIFIDVHFLNTLSEMDYINGWGELLKFSLTRDLDFYEQLRQETNYIPCEAINEYIYKGLYVKKLIIEEDEFESDLRRVLNYGHSFGHALEAYTKNEIPHGTAVIWGIDVVNYIAVQKGLIAETFYKDVKMLIKKAFLKKEIVIQDADKLFEIIKTDKKVKGNVLNFALLDSPSHLVVYPLEIDSALKNMFENYLRETHEFYCD